MSPSLQTQRPVSYSGLQQILWWSTRCKLLLVPLSNLFVGFLPLYARYGMPEDISWTCITSLLFLAKTLFKYILHLKGERYTCANTTRKNISNFFWRCFLVIACLSNAACVVLVVICTKREFSDVAISDINFSNAFINALLKKSESNFNTKS